MMSDEEKRRGRKKRAEECILAADIGGTNTAIGLYEKNTLARIARFSSLTQKKNPHIALKEASAAARKKGIRIAVCSVAAAGELKRGKITLTNAKVSLSAKTIQKTTGAHQAVLVNDFIAQAYGAIATPSKKILRKGTPRDKGNSAVIGAGTGLGKASLKYDKKLATYVAIPSEEGHDALEFKRGEEALRTFLVKSKKSEGRGEAVEWEDALSGRGLVRLCAFSYEQEGDAIPFTLKGLHAARWISRNKGRNAHCRRAFALFARFYGRFAAHIAQQEGCEAGIYFTGGIGQKNPGLFLLKDFKEESSKIPSSIPLILVTDSANGLFGAAVLGREACKHKDI